MNLLKSKTLWFSVLTALTGVVQDVSPIIPPEQAGKAMVGIGVIAAVLRAFTTKPLSEK